MPSRFDIHVDIIIPAHNEQETIANVAKACLESRLKNQVHVIADACSDQTAKRARDAGAEVHTVDFHDKGSVMAFGLEKTVTSHVCFIDGDLIGLTPDHVTSLLMIKGKHGIGLRDKAIKKVTYGFPFPKIAGERILPTWVARNANLWGAGYEAEMRLNLASHNAGLKTEYVLMHGCDHRMMNDKWGFVNSIKPDITRWYKVMTGSVKYLIHAKSAS